jgi:hypothetical protein
VRDVRLLDNTRTIESLPSGSACKLRILAKHYNNTAVDPEGFFVNMLQRVVMEGGVMGTMTIQPLVERYPTFQDYCSVLISVAAMGEPYTGEQLNQVSRTPGLGVRVRVVGWGRWEGSGLASNSKTTPD